ncbi:MAG: hypothetical protein L0Z49_02585 [Actinobacteria bacterium]|nr:hypothetical protein [Actinomycetota bacterium]MCI0543317.1 hypothetical protein [Actinomycetota bacterium]
MTEEPEDTGHGEADDQPEDEDPPTPFTFKLMIVLTVIYLGYRLAEVIVAVVQRFLR